MTTDQLTIGPADILTLRGDSLSVSELSLAGSLLGSGVLFTRCDRMSVTGTISDSITLVCASDKRLIPEFESVEPLFRNDPTLIRIAVTALEVPAVEKR